MRDKWYKEHTIKMLEELKKIGAIKDYAIREKPLRIYVDTITDYPCAQYSWKRAYDMVRLLYDYAVKRQPKQIKQQGEVYTTKTNNKTIY